LHPAVISAWWKSPILAAVERTLSILEAAAPVGLNGKRRDFRAFTDMIEAGMQFFRTHLAELTVASHLAEAGVPFRFNTDKGPDLLLQCGEETFGIEVGSRHPRSATDLSHTLSQGLRARGLPAAVSIRTDPVPPVAIRASAGMRSSRHSCRPMAALESPLCASRRPRHDPKTAFRLPGCRFR
jgi:hypothetical protein